eukprot:925684-Rhodomonas_salina.1
MMLHVSPCFVHVPCKFSKTVNTEISLILSLTLIGLDRYASNCHGIKYQYGYHQAFLIESDKKSSTPCWVQLISPARTATLSCRTKRGPQALSSADEDSVMAKQTWACPSVQ